MNKKILSLFMFVVCAVKVLCDDKQTFEYASDAFVQGDWSQALQLYKKIEHKNSAVWQNMGNCQFNLEQYSQALVSWKRAYAGIRYRQIATICESENRAYQKLDLPRRSSWDCWIQKIVLIIPFMLLKLIFFILLCSLFGILYRCWRWSDVSRRDRRGLLLITLGSVLCGLILYGRALILHKDQAIVVKPDVLVYAGPERTFHIVEKLQPGTLVHVIQHKQGMYQIRQQAVNGWIVQDTLECIYNYE